MDNKEIAQRLRNARGNIPRQEVCTAVGITLSALQMYENAFRIPKDEIKTKLAAYYHMTVQELFY